MAEPWEMAWPEESSGGDSVDSYIRQASAKYDIPEDRLRAVIGAESNFDPQAVSRAGARGLMQLMPGTASDMGVSDPFDPQQNIEGGARYLAQLRDKYDGDWDRAHAAYNFGPRNIDDGKALPKETRDYVAKINAKVGPDDGAPWDMPWAESAKQPDAAPWEMPWAEAAPANDRPIGAKPIEQVVQELAAMPLAERAARIVSGIPAGTLETGLQMAAQVPQMAFQVAGFVKALSEGKITKKDFDEATASITPKWVTDLATADVVQPDTYAGALMAHGLGEATSAAGRVAAAPAAGLEATKAVIGGADREGAQKAFTESYEKIAPVTEQVFNAGFLGKMGVDAARGAAKPVEPPREVLEASSIDDAIAAATKAVEEPEAIDLRGATPQLGETPPLSPDQLSTARYGEGADQAITRMNARMAPEPPAAEPALEQPSFEPGKPEDQTPRIVLPNEPEPSVIPPSRDTRSEYGDALEKQQRGELLTGYEKNLLESPPETPALIQVEGYRSRSPEAMTPSELDLATRLTRSPERKAALQAELDRRSQPKDVPNETQAPEVPARVEPVGQENDRGNEQLSQPAAASAEGGPPAGDARLGDHRQGAGEVAPVSAAGSPPSEKPEPKLQDFTTPKGEVKTFATKALAGAYLKGGRAPKGYVPRQVDRGEWVLSRPERVRSEAQLANDKRLSSRAKNVQPTDDLETLIRKSGGINASELTRDGADPASVAETLRFGAARKAGGLSLDGIAEIMAAEGYDVYDEHHAIDATKARDLIQEVLDGNKVYSPQGWEIRAEMEQRARDADLEPKAEDLEPVELEPHDAVDVGLVARAAEIDESHVERLAIQYENDDAGFLRAIKEFVDGAQDQNHEAPRRGEEHVAPEARQGEGEAPAQGEVDVPSALARLTRAAEAVRAAKPEDVGAVIAELDEARHAADRAGATDVQMVNALEGEQRPLGLERRLEILERGQRAEPPPKAETEKKTPAQAGVSTSAEHPKLELKGESDGEIRAREAQQAKEDEAQRQRDNAPSEKGFTLTGSDRPADEAEARGQKPMFSRVPHASDEASEPTAPWRMTRDVYVASRKGERIERTGFQNRLGTLLSEHRDAVEAALQVGKPVPEEVRAEYPEIARTYDAPQARLRRGAEDQGPMLETAVRAALKGAIEKTSVPIRVVQSVKDLPFDAPSDAKGAYHKGRIWAVADNLADSLDAERTIARHEVTHAGLDALYGSSRARDVALTTITGRNPKLADAAAAWREQYGAEAIRDGMKQGLSETAARREMRLTSMEEALAHFSEGGNELRGWKAFVATIQKGLRAMGLDRLADWLERATDAEALAFVDEARRAVQDRPAQGTRLQPAFSRAGPEPSRFDADEPSRMENLIYKLQDKHVDTKAVLNAIKKTGSDVADSIDPYLKEELFHGRSAKRVEDFLHHELQPLLTDIAARGVKLGDFEKYLVARHAEEANAHIAERNPELPDGGSGMKTAAAKAYLDELTPRDRRAFEALAARVDKMIEGTRQTLVNYGLEGAKTIQGWRDQFEHYVPLNREDMEHGAGIGQGFSVKGSAAKARTGSTRNVVDVLANIAIQRERAIVRGEKNRVVKALLGLAEANPNPDFWKVDEPPTTKTVDKRTNQVISRVDPFYKNAPNVLMARGLDAHGNAIDRAIVFNEQNPRAARMAIALKNLDAAHLEGLIGAVGRVTRYFSSINTQYNPIFGVTNITRDVQEAMLNLTSTELAGKQAQVAKYVLPALRGVYLDTRAERAGKSNSSVWGKLFEEFQNEGGQTAYRDLFRMPADRTKILEREIARAKNGEMLPRRAWNSVFNWLSDYNLAMENSTRLAAYRVGLESGLSKERAASLAKNLTVNFNRKGALGSQLGALYAFYNASAQGTARMMETLTGPGGKKIIGGLVALGVAQAVALAFAGFDDEELPDFVKQNNLVIPIGGKKYLTIPMPKGFLFLPNLGRIATELALSGFKNPVKRLFEYMSVAADAFDPMGNVNFSAQTFAPTVLDPFVALAENKDWTGRPIAREDRDAMHKTPGYTRTRDVASAPGKIIAQGINALTGGTAYKPGVFSPTGDQIDYLVGQATGGVGREGLRAWQMAGSLASGEDMPTYKMPLVGRFYGDAAQPSAQASIFYQNVHEMNEHESEIKGRQQHGEPISEYKRENPETQLLPYARGVEKEVQRLQAQKHKLIEKDAPAEQVKALDDRINQRMTAFNQRLSRVRNSDATSP